MSRASAPVSRRTAPSWRGSHRGHLHADHRLPLVELEVAQHRLEMVRLAVRNVCRGPGWRRISASSAPASPIAKVAFPSPPRECSTSAWLDALRDSHHSVCAKQQRVELAERVRRVRPARPRGSGGSGRDRAAAGTRYSVSVCEHGAVALDDGHRRAPPSRRARSRIGARSRPSSGKSMRGVMIAVSSSRTRSRTFGPAATRATSATMRRAFADVCAGGSRRHVDRHGVMARRARCRSR